jgi:RNA-directed DNA polymerase
MNTLQQQKQLELNLEVAPNFRRDHSSEVFVAARLSESPTGQIRLLESILEPGNMRKAVKRVQANDGAPGIDGLRCSQVAKYLTRHWPKIKAALLDGSYQPLPVRRKEIPKPTGGVRLLGIPAVVDRVIQQAIAQVLTALWDHTFSVYSFGFRPGRSQHGALRQCKSYLDEGLRFVVDIDLSKFFDRVNHDRLLSRLATKIEDKRVLKLIRRFLESGVMINGLVEPADEGTPQGGPLSPLLSNIVLDELDKELERRNLHFVRYADDCVISVGSKRAGERVMKGISTFIEKKLKLKVNKEKSAVGRPWQRKYLGMRMTRSKSQPKISLHWDSVEKMKTRVREITGRQRGRSLKQVIDELMAYLNGWWNYHGIAEATSLLTGLDSWIRRRLRSLVWIHWKTRRNRVAQLEKRGIWHHEAVFVGCARKGAARMGKVKWVSMALPNKTFEDLGLRIPWI